MTVYSRIIDSVNEEKKKYITGQMSLFDLVSDEDKADYEIRMPDYMKMYCDLFQETTYIRRMLISALLETQDKENHL